MRWRLLGIISFSDAIMTNYFNFDIGWAIDAPRSTDYLWEDMFWAEVVIPDALAFKESWVQDQSLTRTPSTDYACTCFSLSHCINEWNVLEWNPVNTKWEELWVEAIKRGADVNVGWYLQTALDMARDLKHIKGYSRVKNTDEAITALASGKMLYTGTNLCNWRETEASGFFTPGKSYGHAFCIVGYDKKQAVFIARNSYGTERYDKGYFRIGFDDFKYLFTCYAILDNTDVDLISNIKAVMDEKMIQKVVEAGIYNWKDGDMPITRREVALMIGRLLTKIEDGRN